MVAFNPATISAGASLVGAVGGLFGSKGKRQPSIEEQLLRQYQTQMKTYRNAPLEMKKGWEKAGIHPIYGMGGSSAQFSPSIQVTDNSKPSFGDRLQSAGVGISRAAEALATDNQRLQNRMLSTQIKGQEIENAKKASDVVIATTGGTPGIPGSFQFQRNALVPQRYLTMLNPDGTVTNTTNPEAGDNDWLMGWDFLTKTLPDEIGNMGKRTLKPWGQLLKEADSRPRMSKRRAKYSFLFR